VDRFMRKYGMGGVDSGAGATAGAKKAAPSETAAEPTPAAPEA
jgi:large subunit ribosomal protein L31